MSDRAQRQRLPASAGRGSRQDLPHTVTSPSSLRRSTPYLRSSSKRPGPVRVFKRCTSEPLLMDEFSAGGSSAAGDPNYGGEGFDPGELLGLRACTDIFASSPSLMVSGTSSPISEAFSKDAKVVVSVTVEGSPGPIRTMVKLGSTVDQTIRLVMDRYSEEGRMPKLDQDCSIGFELHHSYFSLQCLDKSQRIGEVGSRSFYLRRSSSTSNASASATLESERQPALPSAAWVSGRIFLIPFSGFFTLKLGKIVRRTRKATAGMDLHSPAEKRCSPSVRATAGILHRRSTLDELSLQTFPPERHADLVRRRGGLISVPRRTVLAPPRVSGAQKPTELILNVTVERSLGPVQVTMPPESSVQDLIMAAVEAYGREKRRPPLKEVDPRRLELHYSPFSSESLKVEEKLMKLWSRNFFLCSKPSPSCLNATAMEDDPFPFANNLMDILL
ncbi:hypothetical protein SAY87_014030 [Trapa incisa]|uniref:DUF7054 domain-containing protein n=1 Tax=Trapa incisa TaxID=236973 RepID=A0AAN7JK15_9MYRT|nr:hypothetical protein SAY87_014030 [Trapa incisa]